MRLSSLSLKSVSLFFSVLHVDRLAEGISSVGIKALSRLPFLRQFNFPIGHLHCTTKQVQNKCMILCSQFLPRLSVLGVDFTVQFQFQDLDDRIYSNWGIHNQIIEQPLYLGLEELILKDKVQLHPDCQMPKLKRVFWNCPSGDVLGIFNKFQTITELGFCGGFRADVKKVLQEVGRRLRRLVFQYIIFINPEILQFCPNLEYVQFYDCRFQDDYGSWPSNIFCSIREADLRMYTNPFGQQDFIVQVFLYTSIAAKALKID